MGLLSGTTKEQGKYPRLSEIAGFTSPQQQTTRPSVGLLSKPKQSGGVKDIDSFLFNLAQKESSGRYDAIGPKTEKGNRAYGKYQVMDFNIPTWTKQYLGRAYTPQEFLKDKVAQDKLARAKNQEVFNKYGNWEDVASVWFSGRPLAKAGNSRDVTGTTVPNYVADVVGKTANSTPKTASIGTFGVAKAITKVVGQGFLRGTASVGGALAGIPEQVRALSTNTPVRPIINLPFGIPLSSQLTPTGKIQQSFYGTDKPLSLTSEGELPGISGQDDFKPFGVKVPGVSNAMITGAVFGIMDLTGAGGLRGLKGLSKALEAVDNVADASRLMKNAGFADDVIETYAESFAKSKNVKDIERGLMSAQSLQNSTKQASGRLDPLFSEAKKYKSAEEFVKAQGEQVFRGGNKAFDKTLIGEDGVFVTPSKFMAETFGKNVDELYISPKAKVLSYNDLPKAIKDIDNWDDYSKAVSRYGREKGIDVIDSLPAKADYPRGMERTILNPDVVQTKSQLTDIWNKARDEQNPFGYDPTFEKRLENKSVVAKTAEVQERGFIESVKEILPDAPRIAGQYIPRSTDELAIRAKNLINDAPELAEKIALTRTDDVGVAVASELLKRYADDAAQATDITIKNAIYDKAAAIANNLAPKLTEQGRSIQAASILGRLTPEGQVRFAAQEIIRFNNANPTKKIAELTPEQTKDILEQMFKIQKMADGTEKAIAFQKLQDYVRSLIPTPLWKKVTTVWKAGLLTGIKTSGLNLLSNLSHAITETAKDVPAAIVDSVAALFTGKRTKTFTLRGSAGGVKEGFEKGWRYFKTGFDERDVAQKLDYTKVNFGKGEVAQAFQAYTDTVFRVLGSSDQPFYYGASARSLYDQALAQAKNVGLSGKKALKFAEDLVQNPTEEMIRYGVADATTAVFQNETYLGKAAKQLQNIPVVGEIVVPFGRTPSAVAMQIINYSPIGIVKTVIENIGKGKFDQRLFSQGIGRGLTGTAVLYAGYKLAEKGVIALDRPTTERERKLWEAEGRKPNSIKIGGKWRSPTVLGPAGNLLLIGGHFEKAIQESGSPTLAMAVALTGSAKSFTEQTFLTGINSAISALNDPDRFAESYLGNMTASIVPTLVSDVSRATDPRERRPESILQKLKARIPGLRNTLEPQVDVLGNERESVGNPLEIMLDPTRPSEDISTPTTQELRRLTDAGLNVSPTLLGDKKGYEGLTQKQNTELWKLAGGIVNDKLTALFNKEEYKKLDDADKGKIVEKIVDQAKTNARAAYVIELTEGLQGEELKKKLSELKAGGVLTKEVLKKYQELR